MPLGPARYREIINHLPSNAKAGDPMGKLLTYSSGNVQSVKTLNNTGLGLSVEFQRCWDNINIPERDANGMRGFRTGGAFTVLHGRIPGNGVTPAVIVSNFGSGVSFQNRKEYRGFFGYPIISDDPSYAAYATMGGSKLIGNSLIPLITSSMESAAWKTRPKLEKLSLANAIYELREIPALLRQTGQFMKNAWMGFAQPRVSGKAMSSEFADDFLAYQFGWRPFVSDITKLLDAVIFAKQYLDQLIAQNNTWIKRSQTLEEESSSTVIRNALGPGLSPGGFDIQQLCELDGNGAYGSRQVIQDKVRKVWSVGSFKFYRPELDALNPEFYSAAMAARRYLLLLGARINPIHLYQAVPWSWLIDWFVNLGDLIQRADEAYNDGMLCRYLYIMQSQEIKIRSLHTLFFWSGHKTFEFERSVSSKQRVYADSPYGFVLGGSLTATQWSILGALGLSKNVRFSRT